MVQRQGGGLDVEDQFGHRFQDYLRAADSADLRIRQRHVLGSGAQFKDELGGVQFRGETRALARNSGERVAGGGR